MQLGSDNPGLRIAFSHQRSLAAGSSATVEYALSVPCQKSDELRTFILDRKPPLPVRASRRYISVQDSARTRHQLPRSNSNFLAGNFAFHIAIADMNCGRGYSLVVNADLARRFESV